MKKKKHPPERPPTRATWFKFYSQRYLMGGSLRAETLPDERAVWLDFLCLANTGDGHFDSVNRDALATQLLIKRELLDRAINKFKDTKRLIVNYNKAECRETFTIVKWGYYQASPRERKQADDANDENNSSPPLPPSSKENIKKIEIERESKTQKRAPQISHNDKKSGADLSISPEDDNLPDIPKNLPYAVKDKLIMKKAKICELQRLIKDSKARQMKGLTEEELQEKIERYTKEFTQMIEDHT